MNESQIFLEALKHQSAAERAAFLDAACGGDPQLRAGVEALLQAHASDPGFLEQPHGSLGGTLDERPAGSSPANGTTEPATSPLAGAIIAGRYKLLEMIGEGGMGEVWLAEQTEPVKRQVALKVIKAGMDSRAVLARFEAERQALALMDHPNIAKVLDGGMWGEGRGASPEGARSEGRGSNEEASLPLIPSSSSLLARPSPLAPRPYFVMELVKGQPITRYCDQNRLTPRQRLELFVFVCQAVQHAHQKGIIHRDLKPSNVMVGIYDGRPVVKVIDFGVAKAAGQKLTEKTLFTGIGSVVGTLEYMSPEQAQLDNVDIDTRSDIYSLGVLLYELLTGTTPLDRRRLKDAAFLEMLRVIREDEPPKPSTRLSELSNPVAPRPAAGSRSEPTTLASVAAVRHTEPAKLAKLVRGELDWIVMKALDKDRNRRYGTASGFATDLQRYLADESVVACPPSAGYRLRKLVRRNRIALTTVALVALALIVGIVISTWQAMRASKAETLAEARLEETDAARKQAVANLQKAREAVDQMLTRVAEDKLGELPYMEPVRKDLLEDALKFYQGFLQQDGTDPTLQFETGLAWFRVGMILAYIDWRNAACEKSFRESVRLLKFLVDRFPANPDYQLALVTSELGLANHLVYHLGRAQEGEDHLRHVLALHEKLFGQEPNSDAAWMLLARVQHSLARTLGERGKADEAELAYRRAELAIEKATKGLPTEIQSDFLHDLGAFHRSRSRTKEAEASFRRALAIREKLLAKAPRGQWLRLGYSGSLVSLGELLRDTGRPQEAEDAYRRAIEFVQALTKEFPTVFWYRSCLVSQLLALGSLLETREKSSDAEKCYRQALATLLELPAPAEIRQQWTELLTQTETALTRLLRADGRTQEVQAIQTQAQKVRALAQTPKPNKD